MTHNRILQSAAVLLLGICIGCGGKPAADPAAGAGPKPADPGDAQGGERAKPSPKFELTSPTMQHRGIMPAANTCDGEGTSPELKWTDPPQGTEAFIVIVTDPDAPKNFVHWLLYNIPGDVRSVRAGLPADGVLADVGGAKQGRNDFGKTGWGPPCPPAGPGHRYVFRLYAIDAMLDLPAGADRAKLESTMEGHFRGQAAIIVNYARRP